MIRFSPYLAFGFEFDLFIVLFEVYLGVRECLFLPYLIRIRVRFSIIRITCILFAFTSQLHKS